MIISNKNYLPCLLNTLLHSRHGYCGFWGSVVLVRTDDEFTFSTS